VPERTSDPRSRGPADDGAERVCAAAAEAFAAGLPRGPRAAMLDAVAGALDARRADILATAADETALAPEELAPEFARMVGTLRMFAGVVREGSWVRAAVDRAPGGAIGPGHDVRRMLVPLGPVAVFGSSNFPLAYGVCGGDTASAWAAGCPAVVKEHPAHPGTGRLIASIARGAITAAGAPDGWLGYVHNEDPKDHAPAAALVGHPAIAAVGFTGSIPGGLAIERLARERPTPIPVFAEMGSVNPVLITPGAMDARGPEIADELAASVLARAGQQCTKPGNVFFAKSPSSAAFLSRLEERLGAAPARDLAAPWIAANYRAAMDRLEASGAASREAMGPPPAGVPGGRAVQPQLWFSELGFWVNHREVREECFGPATVGVMAGSWPELEGADLGSHLTLSIYFRPGDAEDEARARRATARHARSAGRIIYNGVPTGVRVAHGMVHAGPFPATGRPDATAVGPLAIERWCRPICWQNAPSWALPEELRDGEGAGIWRVVDGVWTPPLRSPQRGDGL
jgi:NADP-dependent aldehyde dehydrogenase